VHPPVRRLAIYLCNQQPLIRELPPHLTRVVEETEQHFSETRGRQPFRDHPVVDAPSHSLGRIERLVMSESELCPLRSVGFYGHLQHHLQWGHLTVGQLERCLLWQQELPSPFFFVLHHLEELGLIATVRFKIAAGQGGDRRRKCR
jgi:hypothetical protein